MWGLTNSITKQTNKHVGDKQKQEGTNKLGGDSLLPNKQKNQVGTNKQYNQTSKQGVENKLGVDSLLPTHPTTNQSTSQPQFGTEEGIVPFFN